MVNVTGYSKSKNTSTLGRLELFTYSESVDSKFSNDIKHENKKQNKIKRL